MTEQEIRDLEEVELMTLSDLVTNERARRIKLIELPSQIRQMTIDYIAIGGNKDEITTSIDSIKP